MERTDNAIRWDGLQDTARAIADMTGMGVQLQIEHLAHLQPMKLMVDGSSIIEVPLGHWVVRNPTGVCVMEKVETEAERMERYQYWVNCERTLRALLQQKLDGSFSDRAWPFRESLPSNVELNMSDHSIAHSLGEAVGPPVAATLEMVWAVLLESSPWGDDDVFDLVREDVLVARCDRFRWCGEPTLGEGVLRAALRAAIVRRQRHIDPYAVPDVAGA